MHDNAPPHSVEGTISYFATFGLEETESITLPPFSSALNPLEQLLATFRRRVYEAVVQFSPMDDLWESFPILKHHIKLVFSQLRCTKAVLCNF